MDLLCWESEEELLCSEVSLNCAEHDWPFLGAGNII